MIDYGGRLALQYLCLSEHGACGKHITLTEYYCSSSQDWSGRRK